MEIPTHLYVLAIVQCFIGPSLLAQLSFHSLGTLDPLGRVSNALGVSRDGSVILAGTIRGSSTPAHGELLRWEVGGAFTTLDFDFAAIQTAAISADGSTITACALRDDLSPQSIIWRAATGVQVLPPLPNGQTFAPHAVSDDNRTLVGGAGAGPISASSYRWRSDSGYEYLGPGGATDTNADGTAVSGSLAYTFVSYSRSTLWTQGPGQTYIDPPGSTVSFSVAMTPDARYILGSFQSPQGFTSAYRWSAATGCVPLAGTVNVPFKPVGMSDDGTVVVGGGANMLTPMLWTQDVGLIDLRTFLIGNGVAGLDNIILQSVSAISGDGHTIVGSASLRSDPFTSFGFYATIPAPTAPALTTAAVLGLALRRRRATSSAA